ncbi:ABC transporter ATP-binding protein [Streptomyces sp. MP131-18]|uniref:ABC transporter ATP-binding protein n=1 Tax=Streptomyces sp. MP131-18 TaxID=1857892 RepID=UPI00097C69E8|nr:ABC transporter ATP-binding protein [Streptomyces sp. MP131-18]ONK13668.1 putative multidrug export ATP-binding/permease protein [Streptomyces sp. MP131-18]
MNVREPGARTSANGDPFEQDALPVPAGAARALLTLLLRPHASRVRLAGALLLLQRGAALAVPLLVAYTIDQAIPALRADDRGPFTLVVTGCLLCAAAAGTLQYAFVAVAARVGQDVLLDLRVRLFTHAQDMSLDFHERFPSGRLTSRATTDIDALRGLLDEGLEKIVGAAVSTLGITAVLLYLDWPLGTAAVLVIGPLSLTMRSFRRRSTRVYRSRTSAIAAVVTKLAETQRGIRTLRAFRRERANADEFAAVNRRHERINGDAGLEMARYVTISRLVANVAVAALVMWGAQRVASGGLDLGVFAATALYLRQLYDHPLRLGGVAEAYQSAAASLEQIAALLAQRPTVPEPSAPRPLPPPPSPSAPGSRGRGRGRAVSFEHVSFAYRSGGEVLSGVRLDIPAGQTVAVVGPTGAGKSTLAKLLARFHDPTAGRVLIDGTDLRDIPEPELRRAVAMVPQDAFLFSGTVADNIAIGRPGANTEAVERATRAIGAHDFIAALPDGYDTDVRARGGRLSAGERQLISLARALLADPALVILDEATSSLDLPAERAVQRAMRTVLHGRTALIIAHRPSTVHVADRAVVIAEGRVVEDGPPSELLARLGPGLLPRRAAP